MTWLTSRDGRRCLYSVERARINSHIELYEFRATNNDKRIRELDLEIARLRQLQGLPPQPRSPMLVLTGMGAFRLR